MISELYKHYGRKQGFVRHVFPSLSRLSGLLPKSFAASIGQESCGWYLFARETFAAVHTQKQKLELLGLTAVSFGLEVGNGTIADTRAIKIAIQHGIDLSSHRSKIERKCYCKRARSSASDGATASKINLLELQAESQAQVTVGWTLEPAGVVLTLRTPTDSANSILTNVLR